MFKKKKKEWQQENFKSLKMTRQRGMCLILILIS